MPISKAAAQAALDWLTYYQGETGEDAPTSIINEFIAVAQPGTQLLNEFYEVKEVAPGQYRTYVTSYRMPSDWSQPGTYPKHLGPEEAIARFSSDMAN